MNHSDYEWWLEQVERMIRRLEALEDAMRRGADPRDPRFAVRTDEVRDLDRFGLELLRGHLPAEGPLPGAWHVQEARGYTSVRRTLGRLLVNRSTFRWTWHMEAGQK